MADQLTANGIPVYRDSGGVLREVPPSAATGGNSASTIIPAVSMTYGMDQAVDGVNATVVSTSPVALNSIDAYNARNGGVRIALYDKATKPAANDTPRWTVYIPGLNTGGREWVAGLKFSTGLAFMLIPDDASGLMAGDILSLNLGYSV